MALKLEITNYGLNNILGKATAAKDALPNQPVLIADNANDLQTDDYILVGKPGGRQSRIYQVQSVTTEAITLTTSLEFYIERGTAITKLFGTQFKLYTAPYQPNVTPTNFTALTGGTGTIDAARLATDFNDPAGNERTWYKFVYYNPTTQTETQLADATAVRDTSSTDYCSIAAIRHEAGFDDIDSVTDEDLAFHRRSAQARIDGMLAGKYTIPFATPIDDQIADISCRLAAGYAMISEYGVFDGMDKTKGEKKRDDALAQLKSLQSGSSILTGVDGVSDVLPNAGGFSSGFSADDTAMFQKGMLDGYYGREY